MAFANITIPGHLPGLNEYIVAERTSKYKAAKMKRDAEDLIALCARAQLKGVQFTSPVTMLYTWIEPNCRRDKDNIAFARKFVQDALVSVGVLQGDGWKHIDYFGDEFAVCKQNPCVRVVIFDNED